MAPKRRRKVAADGEAAARQRVDQFARISPEHARIVNDAFRLGQQRMRRRAGRTLAAGLARYGMRGLYANWIALAIDRLPFLMWRCR